MYDLELLRYLNEQAHLKFLELANEDRTPAVRVAEEIGEIRPPPVFPLAILAKKLIGGPPSMAYFIELLELGDVSIGFRDLVREYLPEYEASIMAEDLDRRAWKFGQFFSEKHFPLSDVTSSYDFTMGDLLDRIPTQPMGFSYESYHSFTDFREGYILALSLIEYPWDEWGDEDERVGESGARVVILERAAELVGEGLSRLIPEGGWSAQDLHGMVNGTKFEGLGDFADWVVNSTGYYFLDAQGESLEMGEQIEWDPGTVSELTEDWHGACEILEKVHRLALLLEEDSESTFRELLALLLSTPDLIIPKEQLPLPLD